jgi:hypothetical protein
LERVSALPPDTAEQFEAADRDASLVEARLGVASAASSGLLSIGRELHVGGWVLRDKRSLACALLCYVASDLLRGIVVLVRDSNLYAAAALLRQLIEVEYLALIGYQSPKRLAEWYDASGEQLRREFTPSRMRKQSGGLFRAQEYWEHCEVGGHPHPRGKWILREYSGPMSPRAYLLPDIAQHTRRLWTSMRFLLPAIAGEHNAFEPSIKMIDASLANWLRQESPFIEQFNGVNTNAVSDAEPPNEEL